MTSKINKPIREEDTLEAWDSWDPMAESYYSEANTLDLNPEKDPECTITGRMFSLKIGDRDVCEHYLQYGACADGQYCDRLHVSSLLRDKLLASVESFNMNKDRSCLTYTSLSPIDLEPNVNSLLLVSVTYLKSPSEFSFVIPYEQMNFANLNKEEIDFYIDRVHQASIYKTKLQKCHEKLSAMFDHNYRVDNVNDDIFLSQIVACKLEDGRFCRAMVVELDDYLNDKFDYKLFLIDVGMIVQRSREFIYDIRADCLSEPPMAINGRLDLKAAHSQLSWSDRGLTQFKKVFSDRKYVLCQVLNYEAQDQTFTVDLLDLYTKISLKEQMLLNEI